MSVHAYQPSFTGGELAPSLYARTDLAKYASGLRTCKNFFIHAHGGASTRAGLRFVCEVKDSASRARLIPFLFSTQQTYVLEFGASYMRVIKDGGQVLSGGVPYEIATPYTATAVGRLAYTQSADTMFLVESDYSPRKLARTGHTAWALTEITFQPETAAPTGASASVTSGSGGSTSVSYKVTGINEATGEESLPSAVATVTNGWAEGDWVSGGVITVTWSAVTGVTQYQVYKEENGIFGFIGATESLSFKDNNVVPDTANTPPGQRNPFSSSGNYPAAVEFFEQRLYFASTASAPQTVWGSNVNAYTNLNVSRPARDDEAVTFTIAARQVNEVRHIVGMSNMILLTSGGEWKASGSGDGAAISPSSISVKPQSYIGSSRVRPLVIGNTIIFVQAQGSIVRDLAYALDVDGFTGNDMSILSNHLFDGNQIVEWAYAQAPHSIVWAVRDDGALLSLTYLREHQVWAWARHETDGAFESVCVVTEGNEDVPYFIVRRTIGGVTKRYIERMESRRWDAAEDCFCVDSGLTYSGAPATEISGLGHLEGKTVAILADGNPQTPQVVTGGKVTLQRAASKVHVGLPYTCDLETLEIDMGMTQTGTTQGRKKSVNKVVARVWKSREFKAGPSADRLTLTKVLNAAYDAPVDLKTGDVEIIIAPNWGDGRTLIRQDGPVPLTVLAIMPEVTVGG